MNEWETIQLVTGPNVPPHELLYGDLGECVEVQWYGDEPFAIPISVGFSGYRAQQVREIYTTKDRRNQRFFETLCYCQGTMAEMLALFSWCYETEKPGAKAMAATLLRYLETVEKICATLRGEQPVLIASAGTVRQTGTTQRFFHLAYDPEDLESGMGIACTSDRYPGYRASLVLPVEIHPRLLALLEQNADEFDKWGDLVAHILGVTLEMQLSVMDQQAQDTPVLTGFWQVVDSTKSRLLRQSQEEPAPTARPSGLWLPGQL